MFTSNGDQQSLQTPHVNRYLIGLLAALPLLGLQLLYLSDPFGWHIVLSEGLLPHAIFALVIGWILFAGFEHHRRGHLPAGYTLPWFSFASLIFIGTFTYFGSWMLPLVMEKPQWCRISQIARWKTSKPDTKSADAESYILVLKGQGNEASHRFKFGWLNWTGDEYAGMPRFKLDPPAYFIWVGYTEVSIPLTPESLRKRLALSDLPDEEVDRLSKEIWQCLDQAMTGKPIAAPSAELTEPNAGPSDYEDVKLGALLWAILLVGTMQLTAQFSLSRSDVRNRENYPQQL